jgi:hypothetical protein
MPRTTSSSARRRWLLAALLSLGLVVPPLLPAASALVPTSVDSAMWRVDGRVREILQTDTAIYLGGTFANLIGPSGQLVPRANIAALDPATGQPLAFDPGTNGAVWSLALSDDGSSLFVGGDFYKVGGLNRKRAAKVDAVSGAVSTWRPDANGRVEAIAVRGDTVYLGGEFTALGTTTRLRLAAVDAATAAVSTTWLASADLAVHDMSFTVDGSRLIVGGAFQTVSGSTGNAQRRIASLDPLTGALQPWASHPSYEIFDVETARGQVFVAAGGSGGHAMAYDVNTGAQQWVGFSNGDAVSAELQNGTLYVGGHFTTWSGSAASHVVALNPANGARQTWSIKVNTALGIHAMDSHAGHLALGGDFTKINYLSRQRFARFSETVDVSAPSAPGAPTGASSSPTTVDLTWGGSLDDAASTILYRIYRDDRPAPVGQISAPTGDPVAFTDTGLVPGTTHTYFVVADDGTNFSEASATSDPITVQEAPVPVLVALTALDEDTDGLVDTVTAQFSDPVSCSGSCTSPWTLTGFPTDTTVAAVSVTGDTATLTLNEGTDAPKTDVGSAMVTLTAAVDGVLGGVNNDPVSFPATKPADGMAPVPVSMSSSNGGAQVGVMEAGDTFSVTFSEPINPASVIAANVKQYDQAGAGNDLENIVGLTDSGMDLGTDDAVLPDGGTIVYQAATLTLSNSNKTITSTIVDPCSGTACGQYGTPTVPTQITMAPEPFLRDTVGVHANGSLTAWVSLY